MHPKFDGVKAHFDKLHRALFNNWKARITGSLVDGRRRSNGTDATVTVEFAPNFPEGVAKSRSFRETLKFPLTRQVAKADDGNDLAEQKGESPGNKDNKASNLVVPALDRARFEILVFKTEGRQPGGLSVAEMREYLRTYGGVSVYDAGFRLPYYGSQDLSGHDWLNVGVDQGRRLIVSELLPERLKTGGRYLLDLPNPGRIFGAVDVNTNHEARAAAQVVDSGDWLQIQPGRDRLAPNVSFEQLRDLVRFGLDLYANRYRALSDDMAQKQRGKQSPTRVLGAALSTLDTYKEEMPLAAYRDVRREVVAARSAVEKESKAIDSRATLLAPLATAGMAALAMNHELSNDALLLQELAELLSHLTERDTSPEAERAVKIVHDYRTRFDSYRRLFSPLADPEEREAVQRLPVESIVSQVVRALRPRLTGVVFEESAIPSDLRFPLGAFSEWSAIVQNILFNAWNAMLDKDRRVVRFEGSPSTARRQYLRISDTGVGLAMPLEETGILFEAFERRAVISSGNRSIAIGGQGLGLAIVRMIALSRDADVEFVSAPRGFATSMQLSWSG